MPLDAKKEEKELPPAQENKEEEKKKAEQAQTPEAEGAEQAEAKGAEGGEVKEKPEEKKQVEPKIHVSNPTSGAAYPFKGKLPIEIECEGEGEFQATLMLRSAKGAAVWQNQMPVKLDEHGKGHGKVELDLATFMQEESGGDRSGKYQLHAFGDSAGQTSAIHRVEIDLIDEEKQSTPHMPEMAAAADAGGGGEPTA
jgi:hypothetical protein